MRIARIAAKNIKGFEDFDFEPGDVNIVAGPNGSNKTSSLALITGLFGAASSRMLRTGAERGIIQAIVQEGDELWDVRREFLPGEVKTPTVRPSGGKPIGAPAAWLKQIVDAVSVDPISLAMNATEKRQAEILLETIPLELDHAELDTAVSTLNLPGIPKVLKSAEKLPALDAIRAVADHVYDERTGVNRDRKTKATHAEQLRASVQADGDDINWAEKTAALAKELQDLAADEARQQMKAERNYSTKKQSTSTLFTGKRADIDKDIDEKIRALETERSRRKGEVATEELEAVNQQSLAHRTALTDITTALQPKRDSLTADHAVAQQNASQRERVQQTKEIAAAAEREATALETRSKAMTAALEELDGVRGRLLAKLDKEIKGLKIENGVAYLNGVPLSEVNTAQRVRFWVRVSARRASTLGICILDNAECLDSAHFENFTAAAAQTGIQWFIGRVDDKPFRIERISEPVAA